MKHLPNFAKQIDAGKYSLSPIHFDIETEAKKRNIPIKSWGRLDLSKKNHKNYKFANDSEACDLLNKIILEQKIQEDITIVWSNADFAEIKSNIRFLKDFVMEILTEDWDVWIFGESWVIEKYHEGELIFSRD
ncbi:CDI toxin immunity protein [Paracidovorax valerianellae]|uniref:CDI toxin immunity protein n=1 Tax=Paracidovorax valerianellae TaxID=187868 RepID=UPI0011136C0F|nr:hypothetical protein [Paracidovorax valerianellae]